jgi:hypothetical protein
MRASSPNTATACSRRCGSRRICIHRFHAPCDARVREVVYVSGDTWNVNPIALKRVERLYCKNERALLDLDLGRDAGLLLVPVAAILVASIRLNCLAAPLKLTYRGPNRLPCDASLRQGRRDGLVRARLDRFSCSALSTSRCAMARARRRAHRDGPAAHARALKHGEHNVPRRTVVMDSSQIVSTMTPAAVRLRAGAMNERGCDAGAFSMS